MNTLGSRTLTSLDDARAILDSKPPFYIRAPQAPGGATDSAGCQSAQNSEYGDKKRGRKRIPRRGSAAGKTFVLWCELVKQLPQLGPNVLQEVRVVAPIAPAPRNRKNSAIHHAELSQVLEHVRVFVILNTVANGLQANAWCGLGGP